MNAIPEPTVLLPRPPRTSRSVWISMGTVGGVWLVFTVVMVVQTRSDQLTYALPGLLVPLIVIALMIPLVIWSRRATVLRVMPERLVIGTDAISLVQRRGTGREWRKADGDLVRVVGRGQKRQIRIGGDNLGITALAARLFDMDAIRAACIEHGWSWQEGRGQVFEAVPREVSRAYGEAPPPPAATEPNDTVLLLRDGKTEMPKHTRVVYVGLFGLFVAIDVLFAVLNVRPDNDFLNALQPCLGVPVLIVAFVVYTWAVVRKLRVRVMVNPQRFAVEYGSRITTAQRGSVDLVTLGAKRLVMHGGGRRVLLVGHQGRAEELRAVLIANGWMSDTGQT